MRLNWNLRTKFVSTTLLVVVITSLLTTLVVSYQLSNLLRDKAYQQLEQNLSFIATGLQKDIDQQKTDAWTLANSRVIEGLLQSDNTRKVDILTLVKQEEWEESLKVVFMQTLAANPKYFKVRYVELSEDQGQPHAKERIVVRRDKDGIVILLENELQEKTHREYIQNALSLNQDQVLLSKLSLNREYGIISEPRKATLRAVAPIFFNDRITGFIIISMDLTSLFQSVKKLIEEEHAFYVVDNQGYYLFHPENQKSFSFEYPEHEQYKIQNDFPQSETLLTNFDDRKVITVSSENPFAILRKPLLFDSLSSKRYINLILMEPYGNIEAASHVLTRYLISTGIIVALVVVIISILLLQRLSKPVQQLLKNIRQFGKSQELNELPIERQDEIGTLARHFQEMSHNIKRQTALLSQEVLVRRLAEKTLRVRELELKRSNSELEKFAYVASHDLQEPLRKVQAFGDRLQERAKDQLDEKSLDYLQRMKSAARRMSSLIDDLLAFSRVTTKGREFSQCSLNKILDDVLSDLEIAIEKSDTQIERKTLPDIYADKMQIRQLLQNLIGNAIKFRQPEGQHQVKIWSERKDDKHHIHIKDNGIGFDEKYADRIFEVFQRLHARNQYEGTGIGLAICRKIVERHNGNIIVHSSPNKGAEFIITLPVNDRDNSGEVNASTRSLSADTYV